MNEKSDHVYSARLGLALLIFILINFIVKTMNGKSDRARHGPSYRSSFLINLIVRSIERNI